jgi:hypothetical protein
VDGKRVLLGGGDSHGNELIFILKPSFGDDQWNLPLGQHRVGLVCAPTHVAFDAIFTVTGQSLELGSGAALLNHLFVLGNYSPCPPGTEPSARVYFTIQGDGSYWPVNAPELVRANAISVQPDGSWTPFTFMVPATAPDLTGAHAGTLKLRSEVECANNATGVAVLYRPLFAPLS